MSIAAQERKRVSPPNGYTGKAYRRGMAQVCRAHSARTEADRVTRAKELADAEAFLADTTSKWCRIVPNSERGRRV